MHYVILDADILFYTFIKHVMTTILQYTLDVCLGILWVLLLPAQY